MSFSFLSVNDKISAILEPGVPSLGKRLETLAFFKKEGIACGMFLLPVVPFITDTAKLMEEAVKEASKIGLDFIIFGGMILKEGKQKDYFHNTLKKNYPHLIKEYEDIYWRNRWGQAEEGYYNSINQRFSGLARKYRIPRRIPPRLYENMLSENDLVVVILEQIDYLLKMEGGKSPFGYAANLISKIKEPLTAMKGRLQELKGVGRATEDIILEILERGSSSYHRRLLAGNY